jgi:hypothetical protein
MEHERGAFKVNREMKLGAVKEKPENARFRPDLPRVLQVVSQTNAAGNLDSQRYLPIK